MRSRLIQLVKEPLVQFLLIGACIYGFYALYGAPDEKVDDKTILVDAGRIEIFIGEWERRWNRPPTRQELDGVINAFVREDILYRQAAAMGLGEDDPITRRRLAQKLEFLTNDIALFREPAEGELEQYFQDNRQLYRDPDLITFSHIFLDPDKRNAATLADAAELLAQLKSAGDPDAAALDASDASMLQGYYREVSELDIRRQLGSGFSEAVMQLAPGQWHGPVLSGYGVHLVYVYEHQEAPSPLFDNLRKYVLQDWQREQQVLFNAKFYDGLKSRYEITIAEPPADRLTDGRADKKIEAESDARKKPAP